MPMTATASQRVMHAWKVQTVTGHDRSLRRLAVPLLPRPQQLPRYRNANQRWEHTTEIRLRYGFCEWGDPIVGFRLSRWLYALSWTGTEQLGLIIN